MKMQYTKSIVYSKYMGIVAVDLTPPPPLAMTLPTSLTAPYWKVKHLGGEVD